MMRNNLDLDWGFCEGQENLFLQNDEFKKVDLPHDFMLEKDTDPNAPGGASVGYYPGVKGTYVKMLDLPEEYENKKVIIEFDGVYMNAAVSLNGQLVARHHYGYTPFEVDITDYAHFGKKNRLSVFVDNSAQPNSRWYPGAGIYRHVDMRVSDRVRIVPNGIYAYTDHIANGIACVIVEVTVKNDMCRPKDAFMDVAINGENGPAASGKVKMYIPAGETSTARIRLNIKDALLWDIDSPNLYDIKAAVSGEGFEDSDETVFGVREISVDADNGFMLNGRTVKLKGGCIHHDNGIVGSESYYDSEFRKLKIQKDAGYNAMRCAHNPPSRDMLLAADRLGMMIIDEAFDCWFNGKNIEDYGMYFENDWAKDIEAFVKRDRNHPSVVIWSTGNEIVERGGFSKGYRMSELLADKVRSLDSTRPITNALCSLWNGLDDEDTEKMKAEMAANANTQNAETPYIDKIWGKNTAAFVMPLDIVGYNYLNGRYARDKKQFPERIICGTESFPRDFYQIWKDTMALNNVIGDFTWTSYDYIGEAGIGKSSFGTDKEGGESHISKYPWKLANDSDFDILGFARPQLALRKVVWGSTETFIGVQDPKYFGMNESISRWGFDDMQFSWTWGDENEGKDIHVTVFSAANEVELFINGKSCGKKAPEGCRAEFDVKYLKGVIKAVSLDDGNIISGCELKTAGKPERIVLAPEKGTVPFDGKSLDFVNVLIVDKDGNRVPNVKLALKASIEGDATIAAFGSADPKTTDNYTVNACTSFDGRAQVIVRSGLKKGKAVVKVESELGNAEAEITLE